VRELRHAVERACAIAAGDTIEAPDLALRPVTTAGAPVALGSLASQFSALAETERRLVEEAVSRSGGNVSEAARLLGITRIMMKRRLDRLQRGDDGDST
jgi:Nif-specific regulatory protein